MMPRYSSSTFSVKALSSMKKADLRKSTKGYNTTIFRLQQDKQYRFENKTCDDPIVTCNTNYVIAYKKTIDNIKFDDEKPARNACRRNIKKQTVNCYFSLKCLIKLY